MKKGKPQFEDHEALQVLFVLVAVLGYWAFKDAYATWKPIDLLIAAWGITFGVLALGLLSFEFLSKSARDRRENRKLALDLPDSLRTSGEDSAYLGFEKKLELPVYLPDSIRRRHCHIIGATGSGKTESVILNLIRQDFARGKSAIVLDAKGDNSFLKFLRQLDASGERVQVFDLSDPVTMPYNPLLMGTPLEAAQRLHNSLTWSEEYYKSKALTALQQLFSSHHEKHGANPTLAVLNSYLKSFESYAAAANMGGSEQETEKKNFENLTGLRDQVRTLVTGHLNTALSPAANVAQVRIQDAILQKKFVYFRLQSLLSAQMSSLLGKLIINELSFCAGSAHRNASEFEPEIVPVFLDEFATFVCPQFTDLISKARSAGFALHFSHQSIGDLTQDGTAYLSQVTDNSATKIILRVNDPDSAEFFARTFGTRLYQKVTYKGEGQDEEMEGTGDGTFREAHQFRASPDLIKTLPTGQGVVLIAHGEDREEGASHVLKLAFPRINLPLPIHNLTKGA